MAWGPSASPRHVAACQALALLPPDQRQQVAERVIAERVGELQALRPVVGRFRLLGRLRGVATTVHRGRVGSRAFGRSLYGRRFGLVLARHAPEHLRRISPLGVQAAKLARERRKARQQWEREHPAP